MNSIALYAIALVLELLVTISKFVSLKANTICYEMMMVDVELNEMSTPSCIA